MQVAPPGDQAGLSLHTLPALHTTVEATLYPAPVGLGAAQLQYCSCCHLPNPQGETRIVSRKRDQADIFDCPDERKRMPPVTVFVVPLSLLTFFFLY